MIRFLFRLILLVLLLALLVFIFAPNLVSTKQGKNALFKFYKQITGHTLTADKIEMSWFQGQKVEHLTLVNPREKMTLELAEMKTDVSLWQLLFCHNLGNMQIAAPQMILNADLLYGLKARDPILKKSSPALAGFSPLFSTVPMMSLPPYLGHVTIKDGNVKFLSTNHDPIELQNIDLDLSLSKSQMKVKGNGKTTLDSIQGDFDLFLTYNNSQSQIDLTANLHNFPMRSLDQIAAVYEPNLKGVLLGIVGETINVQCKLRNLPQTLDLFCDAVSPRFSAQVETATQEGKVTLAKPALIQFKIPQDSIQKLVNIPLESPVTGQIKIDDLSLDLAYRESFAFQATLKGQALQFPWGTFQPYALFLSTENFKNRNFILKIDSPQIQLNSTLYLPQQWTQMNWKGEGLFPKNTHVNFSAQTLASITATVRNDQGEGTFSLGYDATHQTLSLHQPADIIYKMDQLPAPLPPLLNQPTKLRIQVKPLRISLAHFNGPIDLEIEADPTLIKGHPLGKTILLATG